MIQKIPQDVRDVLMTIEAAGYEAFIVGGCVRDMFLDRTPDDWDVTTNAHPEQVQGLFPDSFYENAFGTVGVKVAPFLAHGKPGREHDVIEVTTYRTESGYSDHRRPDTIAFADTLAADLGRRDFTINAMALGADGTLHDPYNGQKDLVDKRIRAVGDANERFQEDALRMMRAVRFGAQLGFVLTDDTRAALGDNHALLAKIAVERIQIELSKIVMSAHSAAAFQELADAELLQYVIPELEEGIGMEQNHHHTLTVWEHNILACEKCPSTKLSVKIATLLHDVGKPRAHRGTGRDCTFYNHEYIGAKMTKKILTRLKYPRKVIDHATMLVRNHMFYYSVDDVTEAAVRRVIKNIGGKENIADLLDVRIGDRLGSGTKKAMPYKLRHFQYLVDKVSQDPVSVKMLKLNGDIMITKMQFAPGPQIGAILNVLLAEVIDDPSKNTLEQLSERAEALRDEDLQELARLAKARIDDKRADDDDALKKTHWVQ